MTTTNDKDAGAGEWPTTMRAWTYDSASGGLEKTLYLNEIATPPPASALTKDAVLVRVLYASLNPADYKLAELGLLARPLVAPPAHPGMDYAGRVVRAGAAAGQTYRPGDLVFGRVEPSRYGTLAEYVVVRSGEGIARVPEGMVKEGKEEEDDALAQLAAVGTCGLTALQSIEPYLPGGKAAGEEGKGTAPRVFINGGSGGTGTFGIQIARALGCRVTTSCSGANAELCRSLGAEEVIDYRTQDVGEALRQQVQQQQQGNQEDKSSSSALFRVVVDNVGLTPAGQQDLHKAADGFLAADGGCFVQVGGGASGAAVAATARRALLPGFLGGGRRRWKMIMTAQSHAGLARIGAWMAAGEVRAVVDEVFPFERAAQAYTKLKTGRAKGKIVVKVSEK